MTAELETALAIVRAAGYVVTEPPAEPEENRCSVCGIPESEAEYERLIDARVITADGEEGFADVVQLLCEDHAQAMFVGLMALGFKDHRHGGANFLEDRECPGARSMDACPTPSEYGEYVVKAS